MGEAEACKFMAFRKLREELPDTDAILKGEPVKLPSKSEVLFILVTAIVRAAKPEHTAACAKFLKKLAETTTRDGMPVGVEVSAYFAHECLNGAAAGLRGVRGTPEFIEWIKSNGKYFVA
jgi:hypothetical protein